MPLTELVHYVNQRHQHVFPSQCGKDVGLKMTEGRVQGQFGAWTLDSLFQPVADSASGQVLGTYLHGLFECPAVLQALFGAQVPTLETVLEGLADFIETHIAPEVLSGLIQDPAGH